MGLFDYNTGESMETIDNISKRSEYNSKCADAIRTLRIFMKDAEEQLKSDIPLSTLRLILEPIGEEK